MFSEYESALKKGLALGLAIYWSPVSVTQGQLHWI